MERTKKLLSWIALGVLLMSNTLTPRTYAQENVEEIEDSTNQIEEVNDETISENDDNNVEGEDNNKDENHEVQDENNIENPENETEHQEDAEKIEELNNDTPTDETKDEVEENKELSNDNETDLENNDEINSDTNNVIQEDTFNIEKTEDNKEIKNTETFTVSFNTDGGSDKDSVQVPGGVPMITAKFSHTPNIDDDGKQNGRYATNLNTTEVIRIDGADKIKVTITRGTFRDDYDWAVIRDGNHPNYNAKNNYSSSRSGKLGGGSYTDDENTKEYIINGEYVTIGFNSYNIFWGGDGYGYYAIIENTSPNFDFGENPTKDGKAFVGWYKENGEKWDEYKDTIDSNITLYAHWRDPEAILLKGKIFNTTIKSLANDSDITKPYNSDYKIKSIIRSDSNDNTNNKILISDNKSDIPIYAWFDDIDGTIYYYSESNNIYMNSDISEMFERMSSLKIIDLEGINMEKVTNNDKVFYEDSTLETIYATDSFITDTSTSRLSSIIGGNGTKFDSDNDNAKYFRPDTKQQSGYFTDPREITLNYKVFGETYKSIVAGKGQPINQPDNPESSGYTFEGWYTDENFKTGFDFSKGIEKFTEIYARMDGDEAILLPGKEFVFNIKKLADGTVTSYNSGDELINSIKKSDNLPEGVNKQLISTDYSKYEVWAWYKNEGGTGTIYYYSDAPKIYMNTDSSYMYYKLKALKEIDINMFDIAKVKSMKYMFAETDSLETIDFKNTNLSNIEDMSYMFYNAGITSIDLSGKNLNKVTTMRDMFYNAKNLVTVDFTNIELNSVTDIETMFPYYLPDAKLEEVKFTNAKIGNLKSIGSSLFYNLDNLRYVDFSGVDLHSLKSAGSMFNQDKNLEYINFDYADLRSLKSIGIFDNLPELENLKFSHAILSGLTYAGYVVYSTPKLKEIDFSYADLRNYKGGREGDNYNSLRDLIYIGNGYAPNLEILNFSNANLSSLESMVDLFHDTTTLKEVNFENTKLDSLKTMYNLFWGAKVPETIIFKNNNLGNLVNVSQMFYGTYSGENIDFRDMDLSNVTNMDQMFAYSKDIKKVDFGGMDLQKVTNMHDMFYESKDLEEVNFSGTLFRDVSNMDYMLQYTKIKSIDFSNKTFLRNISMSTMLGHTDYLEKADFSNTVFSGGGRLGTLFDYASELKEVDFSNVSFNGNYDMGSFFSNNINLEKADFSNAVFSGGGNMGTFFYNAPNLKEVDFSNALFNGSYGMGSFFSNDTSLENVNFSNVIFSGGGYMGNFFNNASSLKEVDFSNALFNGGYSMGSFFSNDTSLEKADFSNTIFSGGGDMSTFFYNAPSLKEVDFSNSKFIGNYGMISMFKDLPNLEEINFENSNFNGSFGMNSMFYNVPKLEILDLSNFMIQNGTETKSMFEKSSNLKTIYVGNNFNTNNITNSSNMFSGTTSIVGGNGTTYDANHIDAEYARIDTPEISGYFTDILDKPYKITYNLDGGSIAGEKTIYTQRDTFTLPTPTKQGYIFKGWIGSNGNNPQVEVRIEAGTVKGNLEYTAVWEIDSGSHSSGGGGKRSEPSTSEVTNDTTNEHNSADDNTTKPTTDTATAPLNEETKKEVVSVTKEVSDDGTEVEVVVEAVAIKNTNIVATVRTETPVNGTTSSTYSSSTHTQEQTDAYSFAKANGITTTESIETAKMNTELTRIQMAKMLSNFAINVLGEEPDVSKGTVNFDDVNDKMNEQYDNAVTKAYQLGIMGQNVKDNEFRPNDGVTRAEFTTALSRLLYKTDEGEYKGTSKYYIPHIVKLYNEGIVNKAEPKIKEKRGYVMTMLKRTVE